jgi:hypothetical protein
VNPSSSAAARCLKSAVINSCSPAILAEARCRASLVRRKTGGICEKHASVRSQIPAPILPFQVESRYRLLQYPPATRRRVPPHRHLGERLQPPSAETRSAADFPSSPLTSGNSLVDHGPTDTGTAGRTYRRSNKLPVSVVSCQRRRAETRRRVGVGANRNRLQGRVR